MASEGAKPSVRPRGSRWLSASVLVALGGTTVAVQLGARADEGELDGASFQVHWSFAGGGRSGWERCSEAGTLSADWVRSEIWEDGFLVQLDFPAGVEVPCLGSHIPKPHRVDLFGELAGGPDGVVFPAVDGRWAMFASIDGEPAFELGQIGLAPGPTGSLLVVWDDEWIEQEPVLSQLTITLTERRGDHDDGRSEGGEHDEG